MSVSLGLRGEFNGISWRTKLMLTDQDLRTGAARALKPRVRSVIEIVTIIFIAWHYL